MCVELLVDEVAGIIFLLVSKFICFCGIFIFWIWGIVVLFAKGNALTEGKKNEDINRLAETAEPAILTIFI